MLRIEQIFVEGLDKNFSYVIYDEETLEGAVVDPCGEVGRVVKFVREQEIWIHYMLNTHCHDDHTQHNKYIQNKYNIPCYIHEKEPFDRDRVISKNSELRFVRDGDRLPLGKGEIEILHTPGHTPGSICIRVGDGLLTGDTLFIGRPGKTIWKGGDPKAMFQTLQRLRQLDDHLVLYPGHDYGPCPSATLGEEKRRNPCLSATTWEEFLRAGESLRIL